MHSCLEIDEIVVAVSSFLSQSDLLSLALTCKQFKEPALSYLWRHMTELEPLLKLFPEDALYKPGEQYKKGIFWQEDSPMMLKRPISATDWLATASYTPYVRRLVLKSGNVQASVLNSAAEAFGGNHVLPGLQELFVFNPADLYVPFVKILLSPCLTHLLFNLNITSTVLDMLSGLGITCPSLVSFRCACAGKRQSQEDLQALVEALSQAVGGWPSIKQLSITGLTAQALNRLSQVASLEEITFHENITHKTDQAIICTGFRSLRIFESFDWPLDRIIEFIRASQTLYLRSLYITLPSHPEVNKWQELFHLISDRSSAAETLGISVIETTPGPPPFDRPFLLEVDTIRPLLAAGNLRTLNLPNIYHFAFTDDFIEELAKASPRLTILNIGTTHATDRDPTLTLDAYRYVFDHCPKISTLGLVVDTSNAREDHIPKSKQGRLKHGEDFTFFVGDSKPTNPLAIAVFLSPFFDQPIKQWYSAEGVDFDHVHGWIEVFNSLLPALIRGESPSRLPTTLMMAHEFGVFLML